MSTLPDALRPWRTPLQIFGDDVRAQLGPWLSNLRTVLGPLRVPKTALSGDPDGVDGLTRRRDYERLLLSEWAIALEAPDEFLRRATAGEHMFLARAFREPQGAKTSVAILDCGPDQLGAPRLAHIAALVVLHQRALDGGAEFRFGIAQDPACVLHEVDRASIHLWLRARTWAPLPSDPTPWRTALDNVDGRDAWVVAASSGSSFARGLDADLLSIEEGPHASPRTLQLHAHPRGTIGRAAELPMPPDDVALRIFRAPLAPAPPRDPMAGLVDNVPQQLGQLATNGRRLFLSRTDGGINGLHVPSRRRDRIGRTRQILKNSMCRLLAADLYQRRVVAIELVPRTGQLLLRGCGIRVLEKSYDEPRTISTVVDAKIERPESFFLEDAGLIDFFVTRADLGGFSALLRDHRQQLWRLTITARGTPPLMAGGEIQLVDRACQSLTRLSQELVLWVSRSDEGVRANSHGGRGIPEVPLSALDNVWFSQIDRRTQRVPTAYIEGDHVHLWGFPAETPTTLERPTQKIIGVGLKDGHDAKEPQLIVITDDNRTIAAVRKEAMVPLYRLAEPIVDVVYHPLSQHVVALTEGGALEVFNVTIEQRLLRLEAPERRRSTP